MILRVFLHCSLNIFISIIIAAQLTCKHLFNGSLLLLLLLLYLFIYFPLLFFWNQNTTKYNQDRRRARNIGS